MATSKTKRKKQIIAVVGTERKSYKPKEAIALIKEVSNKVKTKFDQTVELSINLGVDPKQSDQQVRGSAVLPGGTGKKIRIAVIAKGGKVTFEQDKLLQNFAAIIEALNKAKPSGAKGIYMKAVYVSSTMGPGLRIDLSSLDELHEHNN